MMARYAFRMLLSNSCKVSVVVVHAFMRVFAAFAMFLFGGSAALAQGVPASTQATKPTSSPTGAAANTTTRRPNILFIMSDDHGKQAISCYGATAAPGLVSTPGIDRIAREGMRFDRASVTNAICGPSRAVMLTGKHSHLNGFATNDQKFDGTQQTFPKLLQAAGYRTEVIGKWHLESDPTGFDHWDVLVGQGDYWNPTFIVDGTRTKRDGHATDIIHANALERLRALAPAAKDGKPFAMLVHHKAPHRNWMPTARHLNLFKDDEIPLPATFFDRYEGRSRASSMQTMQVDRDLAWEYDLKVPARELFPDRKLDGLDSWMQREIERIPGEIQRAIVEAYRDENRKLIERYSRMKPKSLADWRFQRYAKDYLRTAQGVDDSVGGILEELDRLGLADNTIVVYTSDQGWFLGEHGWFDKRWMYEESFRMPLVVRWPGQIPAASTSDALVQNLDFAPTFLAAAGVSVPADMQGKSMLPLLAAGGATDKPFRDAVYYRFEESKGSHTVPRHEGVATDRWKLIRFLDLIDPATGERTLELYDLAADPDELRSLAGDPKHAETLRAMTQKLEAIRAQYQFDVPRAGNSTSAPATP
jgi:N-acetylglucosamine-6-sulfatase